MKNTGRVALVVSAIAFVCWVLVAPALTRAQAVGNDAVYNSTNGITFSSSFIDASALLPKLGKDLCDAIYGLLSGQPGFPPYPSAGAVIDARGISGAANLTCTHGSPWNEGSNTVNVPSTILLPAGTITIPSTWALPSYTKLIGEGYGTTGGTVLLACTTASCPANFPTGSPMIQFGIFPCQGDTLICYAGISVENLMLNGNLLNGAGQNINGIANFTAQSSYVDHVTLFQILGTGLQIGAPGSGPYTNLTFDSGSSALSTTTCVNINGATSTRGVHGVTWRLPETLSDEKIWGA